MSDSGKIILFANTDWYLYNFRRSLALALRGHGYEVVLLSPPGEYGPRLRALGLEWQPLRMNRRSINPFREILLLRRLVGLFRRERPALVHSFTIKCAVYGSLAARLAGVPGRVNAVAGLGYVFSSSSLEARLLRPAVLRLLRVTLDDANARLILQNPDDVRLFRQAALVHPERVRLIRSSGVDCTRFAQRSASRDGTFRVLLAARLLWDKGIAEYVQAARILRARNLPIRFLLAGNPDPGNPGAVPEDAIREWVAENLVEWLGHVEDMAALLAGVDAVALPSYYREGVPKTLIEAAACGLPVITTDMPGCREVVSDDVDGLLVPPRDAAALAEAIVRLQSDPELAHRLGTQARAKALTEFDERIVIEQTRKVYEELLPPGRG
ncbi:MAG TPA: glycosyltransferase family 4 protein [Rhodanobacteraceae bacterium]|nr:glycosyltransferase family 4 protein [Rhodanobacteraceae bacterium]